MLYLKKSEKIELKAFVHKLNDAVQWGGHPSLRNTCVSPLELVEFASNLSWCFFPGLDLGLLPAGAGKKTCGFWFDACTFFQK